MENLGNMQLGLLETFLVNAHELYVWATEEKLRTYKSNLI